MNAAVVGSYVYIGKNCVIVSNALLIFIGSIKFNIFVVIQGRRCILKDCCMIADNTVLPSETVVSPFTVYSGSPGHCTDELPEATQDLMIDYTKSFYQHYISDKEAASASPFNYPPKK